jgi:nucleotide-binding universal stress UspA family protein
MLLPTNILVPIDFSETAEHALDYAVALAAKLGARIHVVSVIGMPTLGIPELGLAWTATTMETAVLDRQAALDRLVATRRDSVKFGEVAIRTGDARDGILEMTKETHIDLIVMGTHGRRGVTRALLGSVAESIVRTAPCPVLTVRTKAAT